MRVSRVVINSVVRGQGLTKSGVRLVRRAFGEISSTGVVACMGWPNEQDGINHRLTALAFVETMPDGMNPSHK